MAAEQWITVNGQHILIKEGQTAQLAVTAHFRALELAKSRGGSKTTAEQGEKDTGSGSKTITEGDKKILSFWGYAGYRDISRADAGPEEATRMGYFKPDERDVKKRDEFYAAIDKLPDTTCTAYRGTGMDVSEVAALKVGDVMTLKHVSSFSRQASRAENFVPGGDSKQARVMITAALKTAKDITPYAQFGEKEVVSKKNVHLQVEKITHPKQGVIHMTVREVS